MIHSLNMSDKLEISPASYTAGATATATIDTKGADWATIRVAIANIAQATIASADGVSVVLQEIDNTNTSNATTFVANRTGIKFGREVRYEVDTRSRKRYLYLTAIPGTSGVSNETVVIGAISTMSRKEQAPSNTTAMVAASNDVAVIT